MVYEGCCSYLCWDSIVWMGKVGLEQVEKVVTHVSSHLQTHDIRYQALHTLNSGFG